MITNTQTHMNSTFTLSSYDEGAEDLIRMGHETITDFENKYTIFKESYFNNINKLAGISEVEVDDETILYLELALSYYHLTSHHFNICYRNPKFNPTQILLNKKDKTVFLPHKDMILSLGGIGKGLAVDKCFNFLKSEGLKNFCVNGAGDLRVSSQNAPRPWRIGITNPFNKDHVVGHVTLTNEALATSGTYLKGNHIKSENKLESISCSVMSDSSVDSDVLATLGLALPISEALAFFNNHDKWAVLIANDGKVHLSKKAYQTHMGHNHEINK